MPEKEIQDTWDKVTKKEAQEMADLYDSEFRFCPGYGGQCKESCVVWKPSEVFLNKLTNSYEVKKGECTAYFLKGPMREL
jgi:hypothetical protein